MSYIKKIEAITKVTGAKKYKFVNLERGLNKEGSEDHKI